MQAVLLTLSTTYRLFVQLNAIFTLKNECISCTEPVTWLISISHTGNGFSSFRYAILPGSYKLIIEAD